MRIPRIPRQPARQGGIALFISLVLLLVLTILGVSVVQTTSLEIRMARNEHDNLLAFQAAESALRDAEVVLEATTSVVAYTDAGTGGLWNIPDLTDGNRWEADAVWDTANNLSIQAPTPVDAVPGQQAPRYMIEHIASVQRDENAHQISNTYNNAGAADSVEMFRVTAMGFGGSANSRVMLQTTYGRILD